MKFGVLFRPQAPPDGKGIVQRWQEILHAAKVAEDSGFDGVFLPEHHMIDDGYLPSPLVGAAALAAATTTVDIGTTIHLLPLSHPVQTAEAAAVVDVISNGRLRMGVGLGNFDPEFDLFGINPKTKVSRFEESIEVVRKCWTGEHFEHVGKHFEISAKVTPKPVAPQLWMGGQSDGGVQRAGRMRAPWVTDPLHNLAVMKRWADLYRESATEAGMPKHEQSNKLLRNGWLDKDLKTVEERWWPHVRADHWFYFRQIPRWALELEPSLAGVMDEAQFTFEDHRRDRLVVGSPEDCLESIEQFEREVDPDYMIFTFRFANGPGHEEELRNLREFGAQVLEQYRRTRS
jgi:alkanesulfonate monooxygenase SsuD/methylene tetrahydromethanopterin reductase-like flavin-dependent oxidoreductase (luciferase family)